MSGLVSFIFGWPGERAREFRAHLRITLAGCFFQCLPVDDRDFSPRVAYEAGPLQCGPREIYGWTSHPEHLRHEFLRERKAVRADAVVGQEEPPTHTFLERMRAIAGDALREHCHRRVRESQNQFAEQAAAPPLLQRDRRAQPNGTARDLTERTRRTCVDAEDRG